MLKSKSQKDPFLSIFGTFIQKLDEKTASKTGVVTEEFRLETGKPVNIIEFCKNYLNRMPSPKQLETLEAVFGLESGKWSNQYHEIALAVGMKGGKNFVAEIIVAYACYYLNCLRDIHGYFTKITGRQAVPYTEDKNFDIVNVSSVDESQARRVFFDSVKNVLRLTKDPKTGDNWFERYAGLNLKPGGFGDMKSKIIEFPQHVAGKGTIRLMSFNSTATSPEGIHCLLFLADELSRADSKARYHEAKKLLELGINNTTASFPNGVGKVIGWSYLNDTDFDVTADRLQAADGNPRIHARLYATWEYNPAQKRENFEAIYKADPIRAAQVFECKKPASSQGFFQPYTEKISEAVSPNIFNKIQYKIVKTTRHTNSGEFQRFSTAELLKIQGDNRTRCFGIDPSKVKDRFVIVGGYLETIDPLKMEFFSDNELEILTTNKRIIIDIMIVIDPMAAGMPIDYLAIGDIITQLIKYFPNVRSINSDHFQNEKLRQEILRQGINANTYFFSNEKQVRLYNHLRANVWNNNIDICTDTNNVVYIKYESKPAHELYVKEAKELIKDGNKIDHPPRGSKDLLDAIAIVNYDLMHLEVTGASETHFEALTDAKLIPLVESYMEAKYRIARENEHLQKAQVRIQAMEEMNLSERTTDQIEDFIREHYRYDI